jgi:hypothetical protein
MRSLSLVAKLGAAGIVAVISIAQPQGAGLAFEVASVRPITERGSLIQSNPGKLIANISGNRFTLRMATVPSLIMDAYNVRADQFTGLPDWATDSDKYQINAKTEGEATPTPDQVRLMLQTLLADRFQLRLHHETRNLPVYELTIAKSGVKVTTVPERTDGSSPWGIVSMLIEGYLDYPVVDKTGLSGFVPANLQKFDNAKLMEEVQQARPAGLPPGVRFRGLAPSIFHEVEAQFGLSLKKVSPPADFLVIEHVERPSAN